jgi:membrane associated rhomboid family serine protease
MPPVSETRIALPPFTRWVVRLLIIHTVGYILWLVLGRWEVAPTVAKEMVLFPSDVHKGHVWQLVSYLLTFGRPQDFVFDMLGLWLFCGPLEQRIGSRRFILFYVSLGVVSAAVVTLLAWPIEAIARIPILGPSGVLLGAVVAWGFLFAEQEIYFFGLLPLKGKHLMLLVLGITLIYALATEPLAFLIHGVAAILAALWVKGWVRPSEWWWRFRSAWLRWRSRRARKHLKVVGGKDGRYLH